MDRLSDLPSELLRLICQSVQLHGVQHIASLRLCNRRTEVVAAEYLFPQLLVGPRKRLLRRLRRIAERPKFARGVRQLDYDTTTYVLTNLDPDSGTIVGRPYIMTPGRLYWQNIASDEEPLLGTGEVFYALTFSLPHFPNIRTVTMSDWDSEHCSDRPLPELPRAKILSMPEHQAGAYLCLVGALARNPHNLREFSVYPQQWSNPDIYLYMLSFSTVALSATKATFKHLMIVRFAFSLENHPRYPEEYIDDILGTGIVAHTLAYAIRVRHLCLSFKQRCGRRRVVPVLGLVGQNTWVALEQIELDGVDIRRAMEFCAFLGRHRKTLKAITLRNVSVTDGDWLAIADTIRNLPRLHGLLLEGLEVGRSTLDCVTIMEITDHAIGGRHNELVPDTETILGAFSVA
ncbi:hypothetical protein MMC16_007563 [Acarospora aff. strigata]|nr:hypothetical protein [Acarospora aff. strigata]